MQKLFKDFIKCGILGWCLSLIHIFNGPILQIHPFKNGQLAFDNLFQQPLIFGRLRVQLVQQLLQAEYAETKVLGSHKRILVKQGHLLSLIHIWHKERR